MQKDFDLDTVLSVVYRYNITENYQNILDLYSFMFNYDEISMTDYFKLYEKGRSHILSLYPELNDPETDFDIHYINSYVNKQKQLFGQSITISKIGCPVMKLKTS
jgi:hypothetical protein